MGAFFAITVACLALPEPEASAFSSTGVSHAATNRMVAAKQAAFSANFSKTIKTTPHPFISASMAIFHEQMPQINFRIANYHLATISTGQVYSAIREQFPTINISTTWTANLPYTDIHGLH
jgi:hypothetical protein